ncbi:DUF2306 domain-containing protein [Mycolicibacterium litorale]|uniref:DUF2306 domain-containing protein n=1 Tax=Mycolicibacterium litorale TaxID=758802 RepID=UPI003CEBC5B2
MRYAHPLLALIVVAFLGYSLTPYLTGGTRVPPTFALHHPLLLVHVFCASVAMVGAVVQLWSARGRRVPRWHRTAGRIYVAATVPAALTALVIGPATPFGPLLAVSNVALGALWLWFTVAGYRAVRRGRIAEHRRHMLRSAVLALSVIGNRVWTPVLFVVLDPLRDSVFQGGDEHYLWLVAGLGGWLGWLLPLVLVTLWLRRPHEETLSSVRRGREGHPV